jgi:hypothetical protein
MADRLDRLGLIVNPQAGAGAGANLAAARQAMEALQPRAIVTGPEDLGATALWDWPGELEVLPAPTSPGREQTLALAGALLRQPLEALVVVGGDGTMADVARVYLGCAGAPPLLGIGVGSTNAGRLIACLARDLGRLRPDRLRAQPLDAVLASANGQELGMAFNDGVIGFTVVGTLDGRIRDLDAAERLRSRAVPGVPRSIGAPQTRVVREGTGGRVPLACGETVGTVIVGFAEPTFFGKAVTGGICVASLTGLPAGCLVCDRPLAQVELDARTALGWPPVTSHYLSLDEDTRILVEGVRAGAALCADGNPLRVLQSEDRVEFAIRRAAVNALRLVA